MPPPPATTTARALYVGLVKGHCVVVMCALYVGLARVMGRGAVVMSCCGGNVRAIRSICKTFLLSVGNARPWSSLQYQSELESRNGVLQIAHFEGENDSNLF